jgi:hypothetical protein
MNNFEELVKAKLLPTRLEKILSSGLSFERIFLDGYRNSNHHYGFDIPMTCPLTQKEKFARTRKDKPGDGPKYLQPKGEELIPFFPVLPNWKEIFDDSSIDLIITEGELKASKLVDEGFLAFSMPGVSAYGSSSFMKALNPINFKSRKIYFCFDDDIRVKPQVRKALIEFAKILNRKGAQVFEIELPCMSVVSSKQENI